jgi:hypothetical protein
MDRKWFPTASEYPRKNALTPIGAMAFGTFGASVIAAAYLGSTPMGWVVLGLGSLPVLMTVWGFRYFAINDPDRLQTEDYRIKHEIVAKMDRVESIDPRHLPPPHSKPVLSIDNGGENDE